MKRSAAEILLFNISRFFSFLAVICAVVTVSILLFLRGMPLEEGLIRRNAPVAFLAILAMTFLGCGMDALRRSRTIDRPLKRILETLEQLGQGDYSVRLELDHRDINRAGFDEIGRQINILAGELSGVETLRTDFISNVSHELKTPLAAIQNYAVLLEDEALSSRERAEYAGAIARLTRHLADMTTNILRLNRLENQQIFPQDQVFDLGEQLCECLLELEAQWEEKNLEPVCDLQEGVRIRSDPELLRLVWNNLFSNALKFTAPGGKIFLGLETEGDWAVVTVGDTGCGMNRETGAHIFEKFYQGDTAHATQGNGLGLALVKRVVDITGGVISVSSALGEGSTFTVRLRALP